MGCEGALWAVRVHCGLTMLSDFTSFPPDKTGKSNLYCNSDLNVVHVCEGKYETL